MHILDQTRSRIDKPEKLYYAKMEPDNYFVFVNEDVAIASYESEERVKAVILEIGLAIRNGYEFYIMPKREEEGR